MRQAIIVSSSRVFLAYLGITSINNQNKHINTLNKIVLHDNGDNLAVSNNIKPFFLLKTDIAQKIDKRTHPDTAITRE